MSNTGTLMLALYNICHTLYSEPGHLYSSYFGTMKLAQYWKIMIYGIFI